MSRVVVLTVDGRSIEGEPILKDAAQQVDKELAKVAFVHLGDVLCLRDAHTETGVFPLIVVSKRAIVALTPPSEIGLLAEGMD